MIQYARLARHPGLWRVDGIGECRKKGKLGARATAYFSMLRETNEQNSWFQSYSVQQPHQSLQFNIHVRSLSDFIIGSVWQEGKPAFMPQDDRATKTASIKIDTLTARQIKLGASFKYNNQDIRSVIPESHLALKGNREPLAESNYIFVQTVSNSSPFWLVIPVSEVIRFYLAGSSRLISAMIQGETHTLVDWGASNLVNNVPRLKLLQKLTRPERYVFLRAICLNQSKLALFHTHKYLSRANAMNARPNSAKLPLSLETFFPFRDKTTLTVTGKRMPIGDANKPKAWGMFVFQIHHCTHRCVPSDPIIEFPDGVLSERASNVGGGRRKHNALDESDLLEDEDENIPADKRKKRVGDTRYNDYFAEMHELKPTFMGTTNKVGTKKGYDEIESSSTNTFNDGTYEGDGQGVGGLDNIPHQGGNPDRDIIKFLEMIKELKKLTKKKWSVSTRQTPSSQSHGEHHICSLPKKMHRLRSWHLIDSGAETRARQVVWVELYSKCSKQFIYLVELEKKDSESGLSTLLFHNTKFKRVDNSTFNRLVKLTGAHRGWPSKYHKWKSERDRLIADYFFSHHDVHTFSHPIAKKPDSPEENKENTTIETYNNEQDSNKKDENLSYVEIWSTSIVEKISSEIRTF